MFQQEGSRLIRILSILTALLIVGASFFAGVFYGYKNRPAADRVANILGQAPPAVSSFEETNFNLFWDVWSRLEEKYVDSSKLADRDTLIFGAISGLVKSLGDPYTEFLPPQETKQFQEDIKGSFGGIGAEIGIRRGVLTIIAPLKDTPADLAGLKSGDQVLKVDDTITAELTLNEAVQLIRGPEGSEVRLTILRDSFNETKEIKIVRAVIKIPIMSTETLPDGIFVIHLYHFTQNAGYEFRDAVEEFYKSGSKKLIFDLRNNPGGFLTVAVDIASWFLPPGETVARERYSDGTEDIYRSAGYGLLEDIPTVILVNGGSASASEIVAGALQELRGIQLVGTQTFGKGSVQELQNLERDSSLKLTIAKWLTPKGIILEGNGLEPNIVVEFPEEISEEDEDRDFIMEKGIEVLKGL